VDWLFSWLDRQLITIIKLGWVRGAVLLCCEIWAKKYIKTQNTVLIIATKSIYLNLSKQQVNVSMKVNPSYIPDATASSILI